MNYKDWLDYKSRLAKRDVSLDSENYDLENYFKTLKYNENDPEFKRESKDQPYSGHLPDSHKLPNHPTFSSDSIYNVPVIQQGGEWTPDKSIKTGWKFNPSEHNVKNLGKENLQSYFNEAESPEALNIPENQRLSEAKKSALKSILKK